MRLLEYAMEAVAQDMSVPVSWNEWQKMVAAVRTGYPQVPMDIKALAALRKVTMEDRFGLEWQKQVKIGPLAQRVLAAVVEEPVASGAAGSTIAATGAVGAVGAGGTEPFGASDEEGAAASAGAEGTGQEGSGANGAASAPTGANPGEEALEVSSAAEMVPGILEA